MQRAHIKTFMHAAGILPLTFCCAAALDSCKDEAAKQPEATASTTASASTTVAVAPAANDDVHAKQLIDYMIFEVGSSLSREADKPMWRELVRDMRNQVEAYYNALRSTNEDPERLVRIGLFLADGARHLSAFQKAYDIYTATLKDWDALPENTRNGVNGQRLRSFLVNGLASCLMQQRKMTDALPYYEEALKLDKARYKQLAPEEGKPLPTAENMGQDLENAAEDLLVSYRCLAECQLFADDPEQARETLQTGQKVALDMKNLSTGITFEFVHLLSTLGTLESRIGQPRKALAAWLQAAGLADQLRKSSSSPADKAKAITLLRELTPPIKAVQTQLQSQQQEASQEQPAQQ